jgi:hypothetical protein
MALRSEIIGAAVQEDVKETQELWVGKLQYLLEKGPCLQMLLGSGAV